jgi:hypothetical protein
MHQPAAPSLKPALEVERRRRLSQAEFIKSYVNRRRPVVIEDAVEHWRAVGRWTPEFFRERFGDRTVEVDDKQYTIREIIDLALGSSDQKPAPYYRNELLHRRFPELMEDVEPYPSYLTPNWLQSRLFLGTRHLLFGGGYFEIFIGGAGQSFPVLHYDVPGAHSFIFQIYGRKKFILFAPDQTPYLYPKAGGTGNHSTVDDLERPNLEKFPLFAKAQRYETILDTGDSVFMPSGWWHTTKMLSPSITIGIDVANSSNWPEIIEHVVPKVDRTRGPIAAAAFKRFMALVGGIKFVQESAAQRTERTPQSNEEYR